MLDGWGLTSMKGALMSRGAFEISRLIKAMGGQSVSAYGLAHLGDYEATVFSPYSHNRRFGEYFIQGKSYEKLSEGVATSRALVRLGEQLSIDLPISSAVDSIVNLGKNPEKTLESLFKRMLKDEFYLV